MNLLVAAPIFMALAAAPRAPLVFGDPSTWVVITGEGQVALRLKDVCGVVANELAAAPDLKTFAFTARSDEAQNLLLYACDVGAERPRLLGEAIGYHAQPSFSGDGEWVFFVHNPKKGGPPGMHEPGANSQVYRVRRDGSLLESLTDSKGCKLSPRAAGNDLLVVLHSTCNGPRTVELLRPSDRALVRTAAEGLIAHYPDVSPDGRYLLFALQKYRAAELVELDLKTGESRVLSSLTGPADESRARWSASASSAILQDGNTVWRVRRHGRRPLEKIAAWGEGT